MRKIAAAIFTFCFHSAGVCCSSLPDDIFQFGANITDTSQLYGYGSVPKPLVEVTHVSRGRKVEKGDISCVDLGEVGLRITIPTNSSYKINELGFYFQLLEGSEPINKAYFHGLPVLISKSSDYMAEYRISWVEQEPHDFEAKLIIIAVNKAHQIGLPTVISVSHKLNSHNKSHHSQP